MKILFISSWFPNRLEPTNGNFVQRHAEAVASLHEVEILHTLGDPAQEEEFILDDKKINGIRTLIVYYKSSKNPILNFRSRMLAYQKGFSQLQKPDLVHANILHSSMFFAVYLKEQYKIPFVISEHWSGFLEVNRSKLSFTNILTARFIARKAAYLLPVSNILMDNLKNLKIGKNKQVIGNVVNTELFIPKKEPNTTFTFLHISNLIPLKNPDAMIEAAVRLRNEFQNFEFHIGGDGDVARLNKLIDKHNAKSYIKTFGEISHKDVAMKMRKSDCFVLFSDYESFSCVLLESLSSGVPVIATRVGAIPEIVSENHGIVIDKSEEELYTAMKKMLSGNYKTDSKEELHRYVAEKFSMAAIAKEFNEIYKKLV
ncbi:Glycosyltransferase involved in cell wall bisynthesis [Chryseobacterium ureilyticum]|uniref:Glycosyltransferase involved in cell wall bisynthesis n=1 Tax=Chryseobacterium ureilyticum TaxID=373668 RepID=A0A1N7Q235_9FLAO|nr:glycosyltransferase [Chryseobacterium ureilyticum]SIT16918.1 Glycosyltransferase involved in cell wall bisynthesis [Chryseobacterium ureilyticum]